MYTWMNERLFWGLDWLGFQSQINYLVILRYVSLGQLPNLSFPACKMGEVIVLSV